MNRYSITKQPSEVLKSTALKLREIRKEINYTQVELAERSGVSLGSLKRFESTGHISMESFLKLLHVLNRLDEFDSILIQETDLIAIEKLFSTKTTKK